MITHDIRLRTIKSEDETTIDRYTKDLARDLSETTVFASLREIARSKGIELPEDHTRAIHLCLLALVIADIGTQYARDVRSDNLVKVQRICDKYRLHYETALRLSTLETSLMLEILRALSYPACAEL